jgi:DNA-binding SARP family transcriptional activator
MNIPTQLELRILGPVAAVLGGRLVPLPRPKHRALLAFLTLHPGEVVSTDRLLDALWGERPPPAAKAALQNSVHQLRRLLGADVIAFRPPGYVLDVGPEQTDLGQFRRLTADGRAASDPAARAAKLRAALALWRGPPLAEPEFEFFATVELPPLLHDRLAAQQDLMETELALGRHAELVGELESLVEEHPFDERLRGQLAKALYRAGRQNDALDSLRVTQRLFRDELGLELGQPLRELEHSILVHDERLSAPPPHAAAVVPSRKSVTILSAGLGDDDAGTADPEAMDALHERLLAALTQIAERHGATARRIAGGGLMAVFGVPEVHEDDALRALRAAVEMRAAAAPDLTLRVGVDSGEVYAHEAGVPDLPVTGAPVAGARRLEQLAPWGEIVLGAATLRLVRGAVQTASASALSRRARQPAFRLAALVEGAPGIERRADVPLVDRAAELDELLDAFEAVRDLRRCRVTTVVGEAGIGKTRLVDELTARIRADANVLVGRCVSYGEGVTYLPLSEMLAQSGGDLAAVLDGAASTGEELLALRRHFETLALERPLALVFEDVHWAEPTLLDLVEYLESRVASAPLLVVCVARPDLLDDRPGWKARRLAPLEEEHMRALIGALAGDDAETRALCAQIVDSAEGNPLYAEQLLAFATEGGTIGSLPPTLEPLLSSRLDRLPAGERRLLQHAAVIGREFSRAELDGVAPSELAGELDSPLEELARRGLVRPAGDDAFRFHHVLIRDVAYASLPKAQRADLHERLADRLADGPDELVGYHLEQSFRCRAELGLLDEHARRLGDRAGTRLGAAGIQAWKRGDTPAAVNLLERATDLLPERDSLRLELLCELGVALRGAGRLAPALDVLSAAASVATGTGDRRAELRARLELANVRMFSHPGGRSDELLAAAHAAIPVFEAAGDDRSLSRAWRLTAYVEGATRCRYGASIEAAERALTHCVRSGWSTAACLGDVSAALYYGPTPVAAAIRRCRSLLKDADLAGEANVLAFLSGLEAMRGRFRDARRLIDRAEAIYDDLGQTAIAHGNCGTVRGQIELLAGDPVAAEHALRASYEALEAMGDRAYVATRAAELAEAVYRNGRRDEAWRLSEAAEQTGGADDLPTQFLWRTVRAKLLAQDNRLAEAEALAHEAVTLSEEAEAPSLRADVLLGLAEVLRLSGRAGEAAASAKHALELFEQKGNVVAADTARPLAA